MANEEEKKVNGLRFRQRSFKRTFPFYKDVGGKIRCRERRRTIRRHTLDIYLQNRFYMKDEFSMGASAQLHPFLPPKEGTRRFFKTWRQMEWGGGIGIKLKLPAGSAAPTPAGGPSVYLPIAGVQTETSVVVTNDVGVTERDVFITSKGSVPDNITQRIYMPRRGVGTISAREVLEQGAAIEFPVSIKAVFDEVGAFRTLQYRSLRAGLFVIR